MPVKDKVVVKKMRATETRKLAEVVAQHKRDTAQKQRQSDEEESSRLKTEGRAVAEADYRLKVLPAIDAAAGMGRASLRYLFRAMQIGEPFGPRNEGLRDGLIELLVHDGYKVEYFRQDYNIPDTIWIDIEHYLQISW